MDYLKGPKTSNDCLQAKNETMMTIANEALDVMDETMKLLDELNNIVKREPQEDAIGECPNNPPVSLQEKIIIIRSLAYWAKRKVSQTLGNLI